MTTAIFAKQALTSDGWRNNVTVSIEQDGRIVDVSFKEISADKSVDILLPALANLHSHSFQRAMAGLAEKRGSKPYDDFWSWRKVMYHFLEILTPQDIEAIAAQVQMEMLESGYAACAEFHYLHHAPNGLRYDQLDELSERLYQAALKTGIGYTHLPVLYMRGGLDNQKLAGSQLRFGNDLDQFRALFDKLSDRQRGLPSDYVLGVAPHSLRAVTHQALDLCAKLNPSTPIHIHIAEQQSEVDDVIRHYKNRPVRWLLDHFSIDQRWCLVHATHMDDSETKDLAHSNAVVGLCPITEANLGDGIFKAGDYTKLGGRFGIGSDSNVKIALNEELRTLELSQRLRDQKRVVLTSQDSPSNGRFLYQHAASGGAQALGRNSGIIEVGAFADLVALDGDHHVSTDLKHDTILDSWIFSSDNQIVTDVWAAGRHVVRNGMHIEHEHISRQFKQTMKKLRQAL